MSTEDPQDIDTRLEQLLDSAGELADRCHYRSSLRVSREAQRLAKQERKVIPYLRAGITMMNSCLDILDPNTGTTIALDSIALLESEDHARQFQPDLPEDYYYYVVSRLSTCAYDHLAMHTAEKDGYNSDGVHDCISDGLFVCRRTGKLECIACFREYATDVYLASDDIEMALHHTRFVATTPPVNPDNNRQWAGQRTEAELLLLNGQLEQALEACLKAWTIKDTWHTKFQARLETRVLLEIILLLMGRHEEIWELTGESPTTPGSHPPEPAADEYPFLEMNYAQRDAIVAVQKGDFKTAIDKLSMWDRRLTAQECLATWFEVRLQLIAVYALSGQEERANRLAEQLEDRAKPCRDWLTLRLLNRLRDPAEARAPWATLAPLSCGPFAPTKQSTPPEKAAKPSVEVNPGVAAATPEGSTDTVEAKGESGTVTPSALHNAIPPERANSPVAPLAIRLQNAVEARDVEAIGTLLNEILTWTPARCEKGYDAAWLIYLAQMSGRFTDRIMELWPWATQFIEAFPQEAGVLNVSADLANSIRLLTPDGEDSPVDVSTIEAWFRSSMDLDPDHARSFGRAGDFFASIDRAGDAERCYARGFRLDRANPQIATSLADIYSATDRMRDALTVLDMCIRAGGDAPILLWRAGMLAYQLGQFDVMATYFENYELAEPEESWTQYHIAIAKMESGKLDEVRDAMAIETQRNEEAKFPLLALKTLMTSRAQELELSEICAKEALDIRLSTLDFLPHQELVNCLRRIFEATRAFPPDSEARLAWDIRLLQSGLMPDQYFDELRSMEEPNEGMSFYVCRVEQPLTEDWESFPGCLPGEQNWSAYQALWGVLAKDEEEAERLALQWQQRCYPGEATLGDIEVRGEDFHEQRGIVWQGARGPFGDELDEDISDLDEDEDDEDDMEDD